LKIIKRIKILLIIPALIILGLVWKYWYDYYSINSEEKEKIKIDEYNFEQLEKVKEILDPLDKDSYSFDNIWDFNKLYNSNIEPIKNCYYIKDRNWWEKYIFWFKLESDKYIKKYWVEDFAYPKYDLPVEEVCLWDVGISWEHINECPDANLTTYQSIISNPCKDE